MMLEKLFCKIKIEWWRMFLKYWVRRVDKNDKLGIFIIRDYNKMNLYGDKIDKLYFG